jgi:hypothetical protein
MIGDKNHANYSTNNVSFYARLDAWNAKVVSCKNLKKKARRFGLRTARPWKGKGRVTTLTTIESTKPTSDASSNASLFAAQWSGYEALFHVLYCYEWHHYIRRNVACKQFLDRLANKNLTLS